MQKEGYAPKLVGELPENTSLLERYIIVR